MNKINKFTFKNISITKKKYVNFQINKFKQYYEKMGMTDGDTWLVHDSTMIINYPRRSSAFSTVHFSDEIEKMRKLFSYENLFLNLRIGIRLKKKEMKYITE